MVKNVASVVAIVVLFTLAGVGGLSLGFAGMKAITGWPPIPQADWNDRYEGEWYKVIKTIPAGDIVDRRKLKELGGEECYFFATNGSAHPSDHDVHCVILRKP